MYHYNRPIGIYTFISVFALTLIVKIESTGGFTWMDLGLATLYGAMIWGLGNLLWADIGDIVSPYLHKTETHIVQSVSANIDGITEGVQEFINRNEFQVPGDKFTRNLNKRINGNKLWARGMSNLTKTEEAQLRRYFTQRWDAQVNDPVIPSYIEESLMEILVARGITDGVSLTEYGDKVILNGNLVDLEHM